MYVDKSGCVERYYGPGGKVILPAAVRALASELFLDREDITEVILNRGLETISIFTFCGTGISSIEIPDSVDWISIGAFARCKKLETVRLPKFLYTIDIDTFYDCCNLKKVIFPEVLGEIEQDAFAFCTSLQEVELPDTLELIGARSFENTGLKRLRIPPSVMQIDDKAFIDCDDLTHVLIESEKIDIAEDAFPEHVILTAPYVSPDDLPAANRLLAVISFAEWCAQGNIPPRSSLLTYRFFLRTHAAEFYRFTAEHPAVAGMLLSEGLLEEKLVAQLKESPLDAIEALFQHITKK